MILHDQIGNEIELKKKPERIISLVPSQTELLFDLGLDEEMSACTWFCVHPDEKVKSLKKIGGTKKIKQEEIKEIKPDLIIANKEENDQNQVEELMNHFPVYVSDVDGISTAIEMIADLGKMTDRNEQAGELIDAIVKEKESLEVFEDIKSLYLIWKNPYMSAGKDTFIHQMMQYAGFKNLCTENRYPVLNLEAIKAYKPEVLLLSSEPFPFSQQHVRELEELLPGVKVVLVDGEMFSWYGSRMLKAFRYFRTLRELLH